MTRTGPGHCADAPGLSEAAVAKAVPNCDTQLLRTLHTLLSECSVSRTAERLGQSQPAVSMALRRLRQLTGDPLLVRSGSRCAITSSGMPASTGRSLRSGCAGWC